MRIRTDSEGSIELSDVFNAVVIKTPQGSFGICQRDGGIEVVQAGEIVFSSTQPTRAPPSEFVAPASVRDAVLKADELIHETLSYGDEPTPMSLVVAVNRNRVDFAYATDGETLQGSIPRPPKIECMIGKDLKPVIDEVLRCVISDPR